MFLKKFIGFVLARIYIVSAPSGAGKTSLVKSVMREVADILLPVSHTTRKKRVGEKHGVDYYFVDKQDFLYMVDAGQMIEYAKVFGNYYGVSKEEASNALGENKDIFFEIDWQGARSIKEIFPNAVSIFIMPPSLDVLRQRLVARGQDDEMTIDYRMELAINEMSHKDEYDHIIINDCFEESVSKLIKIIINNR